MELLGLAMIFGFFFVALSFLGGFAGAVAAGGREDRSLLANFGIGFIGTVIGSAVWAGVNGAWPEEMTGGVIVLAFLASIGVAIAFNRRERRRAERAQSDSGTPGVSA